MKEAGGFPRPPPPLLPPSKTRSQDGKMGRFALGARWGGAVLPGAYSPLLRPLHLPALIQSAPARVAQPRFSVDLGQGLHPL